MLSRIMLEISLDHFFIEMFLTGENCKRRDKKMITNPSRHFS